MKKQITAAILGVLFGIMAFPAAAPQAATAPAEDLSAFNETASESYTIMDRYTYQLSEPFAESPDSFEAWVNMPSGSLGGTLMSNRVYSSKNYEGTVEWSVDAIGRVCIYWDNGNFQYTFANAYIGDGQWHHVAVVRDPSAHTFTLYVDGEEKDRVISNQDDAAGATMSMRIGVDYRTFTESKQPFEGYIRQITVYSGAIEADRVRSDMQTEQITDTYDGNILGNWVFGEKWTQRFVEDTTANENDANLCTFDKYVGIAGEDFEYDYMLVGIPDVQTCVRYRYNDYRNMMQWLADNASSKKMAFAWQVGDLSDSGPMEELYQKAAAGISLLDGKLPYSFVPGNHDYDNNCSTDRSQEFYNKYFPYEKYSSMPNFGGAFIEGDMANTYYLYEVCGVKYLVLNLEFGPRMAVIRWAGRICEMYPQHRVIINTHGYLNTDGNFLNEGDSACATSYGFAKTTGATSGQQLYDGLVKRYPNIFMVFSGHVCYDDVVVRYDTGIHGNTITSMLIDTQTATYDRGIGEDIVFLMKVNEKTKTMRCYYYSPLHDGVYNIQNQFDISFADEHNPAI